MKKNKFEMPKDNLWTEQKLRADKALEEYSMLKLRHAYRQRKEALRLAVENGNPADVYNWCYHRAMSYYQIRSIKDQLVWGNHKITDEDCKIITDRWHRWFYRICKMYGIDHGWGIPN